MKQRFKVTLIGRGPRQSWAFLIPPFSVEKVWGTKGRLAVCGTINAIAFRNSLMPEGDGTHAMMVNQDLRAAAGAAVGDEVEVVMEADTAERKVEVPAPLQAGLAKSSAAKAFFATLSPSRKKEYADWIASAKRAETVKARVASAIDRLARGQKLT